MKKIEAAAALASPKDDAESAPAFSGGFIAGARYVLDAMVSDAAVRAIDRVRVLRTSTPEQLAAVRKEIEGAT